MKCPTSLPGALILPWCSSLSGVWGQVWCGTWAGCVTEQGAFTDRAQPADRHWDIYRCKGCRGRCMRAVQRPHYFRSKVCAAQNPLSSLAQEQMLRGGGQAWLKLPAASPPSTWPRVWAQLQEGCETPNIPLISAVSSRSRIIWF